LINRKGFYLRMASFPPDFILTQTDTDGVELNPYSNFTFGGGASGYSGVPGASGFSGFSGYSGLGLSGYSGYSGATGTGTNVLALVYLGMN
jgi:hypothetical protein